MCMSCYKDVDNELGDKTTKECNACNSTGIYTWGPVINGKPSHQNKCFACNGKGTQTRTDLVRQYTYYAHRIQV